MVLAVGDDGLLSCAGRVLNPSPRVVVRRHAVHLVHRLEPVQRRWETVVSHTNGYIIGLYRIAATRYPHVRQYKLKGCRLERVGDCDSTTGELFQIINNKALKVTAV